MKSKEEMIDTMARAMATAEERHWELCADKDIYIFHAEAALKALCGALPELEQPQYGTKAQAEIYNQLKQYGKGE